VPLGMQSVPEETYVADVPGKPAEWKPTHAPKSLLADRASLRQSFLRSDMTGSGQRLGVSSGVENARPRLAPTYAVDAAPPRAQSAASSVTSGAFTVDGGGRRRAGGESALREKGPVVHDMEGLKAQVLSLKKELSTTKAENRLLRVAKERMEAELRKAEHEGEQALRSGGIVDGGAASRADARLLRSLKAKTRELHEELQAKEAQLSELSGATKGMRLRELEVQTKVYLDEARRLKEVRAPRPA
jgi:hypothetical protein